VLDDSAVAVLQARLTVPAVVSHGSFLALGADKLSLPRPRGRRRCVHQYIEVNDDMMHTCARP
jgi:hypothetical protein